MVICLNFHWLRDVGPRTITRMYEVLTRMFILLDLDTSRFRYDLNTLYNTICLYECIYSFYDQVNKALPTLPKIIIPQKKKLVVHNQIGINASGVWKLAA